MLAGEGPGASEGPGLEPKFSLGFSASISVFSSGLSPQPGFCHQQAQDWGFTSGLLRSPPQSPGF